MGKVFQGPVEGFNLLTGNTPRRAAVRMNDSQSADERREGILYLSARGYGQSEPYTDRYEQIARTDADYTVRAAAIRALNRSRDAEGTPVFIAALNDPSELVRMEAAKALANHPGEKTVPALIAHLTDPRESKDVRIAVADALRHYRNSEAARALIRVLQDRNFGVAWQSRQSLKRLTGRDYHYDEGAWLQYLTENPFD